MFLNEITPEDAEADFAEEIKVIFHKLKNKEISKDIALSMINDIVKDFNMRQFIADPINVQDDVSWAIIALMLKIAINEVKKLP